MATIHILQVHLVTHATQINPTVPLQMLVRHAHAHSQMEANQQQP